MPSPWVTRALRSELPAKSLDSFSPTIAAKSHVNIPSDERVDVVIRDSYSPSASIDADPADAYGTVRALRAFGIVR